MVTTHFSGPLSPSLHSLSQNLTATKHARLQTVGQQMPGRFPWDPARCQAQYEVLSK